MTSPPIASTPQQLGETPPQPAGVELPLVCELSARAYTIPTDGPEADGTLAWDSTTLVLVGVRAGNCTGIGFSYTASAAAGLVRDLLAGAVVGYTASSPQAAWERMRSAVRNVGRVGLASSAIAAVDVALWDLKARLLGLPLTDLLGRVHESVPVYGSGGFTSYNDAQLAHQLEDWLEQGITRFKIKVGSQPECDPARVRRARAIIGDRADLFVDANGAYERRQALTMAETFAAEASVCWFEEPVSSDDLAGLAAVRERTPAGMNVAAGEYGWDLFYFRRMVEAGAVDVLQADVTRCGGITEMLRVAAICSAAPLPLSAHTSPVIHAHVGAALPPLVHVEYFHDHARIETMLFEGVPQVRDGVLRPDPERPGLGLELRAADAERFAA